MSRRYAVLVGLTHVDPKSYQGWDGRKGCWGCERDVESLRKLLRREGFADEDIQVLKSEGATAAAVLDALRRRVWHARVGDLVVLFYSGHGGQVQDQDGDEDDLHDETLCLFDREVVDDEIGRIWGALPRGAYGLMISDACHSGTNAKARHSPRSARPFIVRPRPSKDRGGGGELIQIGAAHDSGEATGLSAGGLFTLALERVAATGLPSGYRALRDRIQEHVAVVDPLQDVQYVPWDQVSPAFAESRPFSSPGAPRSDSSHWGDDYELMDEDTPTDPDHEDGPSVRANAWRPEDRIAAGQQRMRKREKDTGKLHTGGTRDPATVDGIVLHQTGFARGPEPSDYDGVTAHFIVTPTGRCAQIHPVERVLYAANEFNTRTVSIEFVGNFPSVRHRWWKGAPPTYLSRAQVESGKALLAHLRASYPQLRFIHGHIQSKGEARGNDPGPDLWCTVGEFAIRELGMILDHNIHKVYDGLPIPESWRTWTPRFGDT